MRARNGFILGAVLFCCFVLAGFFFYSPDRPETADEREPTRPPLLPYQDSLKELDGIDLKQDSALDRIDDFLADERHPIEAKLVALALLEVPARQHGKTQAVKILKSYVAGGKTKTVDDQVRSGAASSLANLAIHGIKEARTRIKDVFQNLPSWLRTHLFEVFGAKGTSEDCGFLEELVQTSNLGDKERIQLLLRVDRLRAKSQ